jgi:hypothetical protein
MFKVVMLMKRRPGMTPEAFKDYYETTHARIGERVLPTAERYFRRFLTPLGPPAAGPELEPVADVITEIWFKDHATYEATMLALAEPATIAEIVADEENLFDRTSIRMYAVDERESDLKSA